MIELPTQDLRWWLWLTREEWQLAYALSFAADDAGLLADLGLDTVNKQLLWAVSYLNGECGYELKGIHIRDDGEYLAKQEDPVEPGNVLTIQLMRRMETPDYAVHVPDALAYARERRIGGAVIPLLEEAYYKLGLAEAQLKDYELPEGVKEQLREAIRKAMGQLKGEEIN